MSSLLKLSQKAKNSENKVSFALASRLAMTKKLESKIDYGFFFLDSSFISLI
ncbi:hypothetical protein HFN_1326 [Helicobacter fennelliae MRY12-0050]|uniref:Uncharacterized protein n=1 Tax=Helicobacter fennelliae MRY12-0050 TaxID=1325130 RepID=T1DXA0_9HELI|nr:hypothetical protein HFN_1326 [Helicobacter fennelliae MRY12-0050]